MKKKITLIVFALFVGLASVHAQVSCPDLNGYVDYKNVGGTGNYILMTGIVEKAAQTYHYSGPGKITSVRVYGSYFPAGFAGGGVPLRVGIYNVDANGRPTSLIQYSNIIWWWYNNFAGYVDASFGSGGVPVSHNFAVEVELRSMYPWGNYFNLRYTGNGEGRGEDLASLAGTSTGGNWTSAKTDFSKDGDFYIVPKMTNFITSGFSTGSSCVDIATPLTFTNLTQMSLDSTFNTIGMSTYTGSDHYYEWNFGDGSPVSYETNPTHSFSTPGVYSVSLKSTLVGWSGSCSDTKTMQISVGLSVSAGSVINASCFGSGTGSILAQGSGGAINYSYSLNSESYQPDQHFNGLHAGSYTLYVRDNLGCTSQTTFNITEPPALNFAPIVTTNASCGHSDGGILVAASGGTGTIQYQLNTGTYQLGGSFSNLAAGTYAINIKDANSCTATILAAVNDAGGPILSVTSMTNVSCSNGSDGSIVLNGTGGSGTLQYSINGGSTYQTSGSFLNIPAGSYGVIVKDAASCSQSMVINITQPQALRISAYAAAVSCHSGNNGQIHVINASGGTGSFSYSINGSVYQSGTSFLGLTAGTYTVYVKDVASCIATTEVVVSEPNAVSASVSTTPASCNGSYDGSITIAALGGAGNYSYSIYGSNFQNTSTFPELPAGGYTVRVRDENNCLYTTFATINQPTAVNASINTTSSTCGNNNGGFLATPSGGSGSGYQFSINDTTFNVTGLFNGLSTGTYYLIVADGAGCNNVFPVNIIDANGPTITASTQTNVSCNGGGDGTITLTGVSGGTGTLQYSINGSIWQTSSTFTGLAAGTYIITVKDANGCTGTVTHTLSQPNGFVINTSLTNNTCNGDSSGAIVIYASGGAGVLAYSIDLSNVYQSSNVFDGLFAGTHLVTVRDAAGCNSSIVFNLTQPTRINVTTGVLDVSCHAAGNGSIALNASGGTGTYQYSLNNTTFQNSNIFANLSGGLYTVYVRDASNCLASLAVPVKEPLALVVIPSVNNVSCSGGNNGSVSLEVRGGVAPYSYWWSTNVHTQDIFNLTAGSYSVKVQDDNGCSTASTYEVTQPPTPLVVNGVVTDASTTVSTDGAISLAVTGGVSPYTYLWSNEAISKDISGLVAGTYHINVTDANGCIVTGGFIVSSLTGISNVEAGVNAVMIYPNPSSEIATIEVKGSMISTLKIVNVNGQVVFESEPKQPKVQINSNILASGIYFVQVLVDGNFVTRRMIVSR